ncbi:MAG: FAD-binding protein [Proteobacteria bacterium]|nr:FAD-binding protein [Pseudomonadota bacterium]
MILKDSSYKKIQDIVGSKYCSRSKEDLICYSYDGTANRYLPDAVVFPEKTSEVSSILKLASLDGFFVIPRGSGTGMTGGSVPVMGGVVIVMNRFNHVIEIDTDNFTATVEPGVITAQFHREVEKFNLFYPPDPSSSEFSTLGGNLAECAGGPRAVKYGVTRDYVLGLEAVLPTGEVIKTGVKTAKGVVGYDLTRLLIGSEGTLGIITQITVKLLSLPESVKTMTASFPELDKAAKTVSEIIRQGIVPRTIEFMDKESIKCVEKYLGTAIAADSKALLIIEVDGRSDEAESSIKQLKELCISLGAKDVRIAGSKEDAALIWKARKSISPALFTYAPDKINEDIVVPRSKIPDMVQKINSMRNKTGLTIASFGHAGDGNIHFNIMLDKKNSEDLKKAETAIEELFDYTIELGGTISGEHGVGITKAAYMAKEIGPVEIELMKKIKNLFDPKGILNPGKMFVEH